MATDETLLQGLEALKREIDIALERGFAHIGLDKALSKTVLDMMLYDSSNPKY